ncbi:MAG: ubiquitin-like domain-containing protein, partial [Anaerolineales bacterium]|nr:ubiquitin-like domain-containing protein [Anaerolineales bacterium]
MNIRELAKNPLLQRISAVIIVIIGIILLVISANKPITLVINGELQEHTTFAFTVKGFLENQGIALQESDRVYPTPNTLLWGGETVLLSISRQIEISADGQTISLITAERLPENIILEAGLHLFPKDRILVDGILNQKDSSLPLKSFHSIQVLRGTAIELISDEGIFQFTTDAEFLADALWNENIELFEADQLSIPLNTKLDGTPLSVELTRSKPLMVLLPEDTFTIRTTATTVGAALAQSGHSLQGLDYSNPPEGAALPENGQIQITRVREEILLNQEQVQFSTEYQPVNDLDLDQLQIVSGGEFGIEAERLRILYENGVEISREIEKEWTIKEPKPRIIGYGTNINIQTENTQDGQIRYWRKITAWATSYDSSCPG